jgi:hypothetical protein
MEKVVAVVALIGVLVIVARGHPQQRILLAAAVALALVLVIVGIERNGWWPQGWQTR